MSFEISTQSLLWRPQDTDAKQVTFSNTLNNIDPAVLRLTIGAPVSNSNSDFFWAVPGPQLLGRGRSFSLTVKPPMWASGAAPQVKVGSVPWNVVDAANGAPLQDGNIELRNDAVSSVLQGELAITQLVSNPPGQDLSPEGEFFELRNLTARPLNLDRCQVMQRTFSLQGNPSDVIAAKFGGPPAGADFGKNWTLPPVATLRVLTRGKANSDPFDDPLRFYLNKGNPIWNNAGDRITVLNADGYLLARFSYGNQANQAGFPDVNGPSGPAQGAPLTLFSDFTVSLNATFGLVPVFTLEPDDVVIFSTTEATLISVFLTTGAIGNGTVGNSPGSPERLPRQIPPWTGSMIIADSSRV